MHSDKDQIEAFLEDKAFYCERYKATISNKQCIINCARTLYNKGVFKRRMDAYHKDTTRFGNDEYIFYTKLCLGKMTCDGCPHFQEPSKGVQKIVDILQTKSSFYSMDEGENYSLDTVSACSSL